MGFAVLASCASEIEPEYFEGDSVGHITFSPMFSAYDGVHELSVTPSVADAKDGPPFEGYPISASSIRWEVDDAFVSRSEVPDMPHAIKLTTKKSGRTFVTLIARHLDGPTFRQRAALTITRGTPKEWEAGEARFEQGPRVSLPEMPEESDAGECGLAEELSYPNNAACRSCHEPSDMTPTSTAGYSDDDLVQIISAGTKPAGASFYSDFLQNLSMPDCVWRSIHSFDLSEEDKRGIVLKLRSIPPTALPERSEDLRRIVDRMRER